MFTTNIMSENPLTSGRWNRKC